MRRYPEIIECEGVYPPREDSYLLLKAVQVRKGERLLDIGTGTGIIAIAAALESAEVTATDISEKALRCAEMNAKRNGVEIEFVKTNIAEGLKKEFDVITFNPPYLPESGIDYGEISGALEGGDGGAEHIERMLSGISDILKPGGRVYFVASSLTNTGVLKNFHTELIAEKKLFFERLYVFMHTL